MRSVPLVPPWFCGLDTSGMPVYNEENFGRSEVFYVKRGEITIA